MKNDQNTVAIESKQVAPSQDVQPVEIMANEPLASEPSKDASLEVVKPRREVQVMGNRVCMDELLKKLQDARSDSARLEALCIDKGIVSKRKLKSVQGTGLAIVDLGSIAQLAKLGMIQGKPEKVKARVDAIKGMNLLIDALTLLGLAERQEEY